ncbi:osmoprotectant update ABC transporter permease/substrate-binding subunit OpuFB [Bacillus sonorensis]|uniref:Choline transport system permease protein OpuBB n=2 Tax=Bacillus sonorensis TaxID=119858 RepID=A0ABN5AE86_9BACI|nr:MULTISPECIES: osmoprotectant update ABC transporter permease/substrate-binding subunit OpuFB [Bacillus]TWK84331.1 Choline transport system permease protein OpuBB [Bacillus paralicheniformis]ASB89051.1 Choline transport system permease protein OpuBB [Bacillus sonorensis]EME75724.1 glycine betaine/L-proline ABC transporter binding protein [Bacillus sonorensis L12]MBG9915019.1 glycine/betaine ABC transporter permease [Bacillus sonorensis]MCF7618399.1 osmoprotectant update ABC transporter perme
MNNFFHDLAERKGQLINALLEHIQISLIALFFAVVISIPLGIYLTRKPKIAEGIIGVTAVLQTIPSLALLGLLIPIVGIGKVPAIIALIVYALLPILRNTYTGIKEIDPSLLEAARAMGMNSQKRLIKVELPLAMPVIMAGIRTAMVLIVGTATLAALIGAGGLGDIILLGIDRNNTELIVLGAIPAAILAIIFDFLLRSFEKLSFKKLLVGIGGFAAATIIILALSFSYGQGGKHIVIAGKLGSEPDILINMYKLLIEEDTDLHVEVKPGFGKTSFVFQALKSGDIDVYPEFTGTAISEFLKETPVSTDQKQVYEQARKGMLKTFDMTLLKPMAYNNTYALAVPKQLALKYHLKTISDLKKHQENIKAGFTLEFADREDGYRGIQNTYGITFSNVATMEPKLRYNAIKTGDIQVVDAYSTDSELEQYNLSVLKDDKHVFPPYQGAPLLRKETLQKYPEIEQALNKLAGKISDRKMREMNYQVNVKGKPAEEVARGFLQEERLLK